MVYKTFGTCSREINFEVVDNKLTNVSFLGGCNGNLQGISKLVEGMDIVDAIASCKTGFMDRPVEEQKIAKIIVEDEEFKAPEKC